MTFQYNPSLQSILQGLEEFLLTQFPSKVKRAQDEEPVYALFLWYDDSSPARIQLSYGFGTQSILSACASKYPDKELRNDCIWRPQQIVGCPHYPIGDADFDAKTDEAYELMLAANTSGVPLEDEGELFMPLRSMMHSVAQRLNDHDWTGALEVTDGFVVAALDSIGYWTKEDLLASIPPTKYAALQSQGMM